MILAAQMTGFIDACIDDQCTSLETNEGLNNVVFNQPFSNLNR
tara:strand:- start:1104 stop:1232 length:129 start_codon:yes stop_codon:yes gene_type:complete